MTSTPSSHGVPLAAALSSRRRAALDSTKGRDPRAVPQSMRTNATVPASCAFYGLADSLTQCRVPRSCYDCLATPGCVIQGSTGICVNASATLSSRWFERDFHALVHARPNQTQFYSDKDTTFFAANATYCDASDRVCAACTGDFQALALGDTLVRGQFCLGQGDCVCVGACEVPAQRARYVYDAECGQPLPPEAARGRVLPLISSRNRDPRAPQKDRFHRTAVVAQCKFDGELDVKGCKKPRSCASCLHRPDCVVEGGECLVMDAYNNQKDFRVRTLVNESLWSTQIPASNTSYCPAQACETCRVTMAAWVSELDGPIKPSYWLPCVDQALGCVCPELCDYVDATRIGVGDGECLDATGEPVWELPVTMILLLVIALRLARMWYNDTFPNRRPPTIPRRATVMRHMLDQLPAVPALDLFGWRQYQQRLLEKEEELLGGAESVSPVHRLINYDLVSPSAPDIDEEDVGSAPVLTDPTAQASAPASLLQDELDEADATLRRRGHASPNFS